MRPIVLASLTLLSLSCAPPTSEPTGTARQAVWATLPNMAEVRNDPGAARLSATTALLVAGEAADKVVSTAEVFDLGTRTWKTVAPMKEPRRAPQVAVLADGRVLVAGGLTATSSAEIYDPKTGTWTSTPPMRSARGEGIAVLLADGTVLVAGGWDTTELNSAEIYSPTANTWSSVGPMSIPRHRFSAVRMADGRVFVAGGFEGTVSGVEAKAEVYDPATRTFREVGTPLKQTFDSAAALLPDGRVFLTGGYPAPLGADSKVTWLFDPKTNALTKGPPLPEERQGHSMTVLPSGRVLFVGGDVDGSTRVFDPASGTFGAQEFLVTRRYAHAAVLLEGALLVAGGTNDLAGYSGDTESAELWTNPTELADAGGAPITTPPATSVGGTFARCIADDDCPSKHCSDGVCCDTACKDRCHSCALPSSPGVCTLEPVGVDLRNECGAALSCSGTCGPGGECIGSTKGSLCARSRCVSATQGVGPAVCTESGGACPVSTAVAFDCLPYTCEPAFGACRTTCSSSAECAGGFVCELGTRTCVAPAAASDDSGCAVGNAGHDGAFPLALLALAALLRRRQSVLAP